MATFKGYSSVDLTSNNTKFTDYELVKRDLINHFYTRTGERLYMPEFGCSIWNLIFEQNDSIVHEKVVDEVNRIIKSEPRIQLIDLQTEFLENSIALKIEINYLPKNITDTMYLTFTEAGEEL